MGDAIDSSKTAFTHPWAGKNSRHAGIVVIALCSALALAVFDGARFYSDFKRDCNQIPNRQGCSGFMDTALTNDSPIADLRLDHGKGAFAIQLGTFPSDERARNLVAVLERWGLNVRQVRIKGRKKNKLTQLQLGRFPDAKTARETAAKLKSRGVISDFTVGAFLAK